VEALEGRHGQHFEQSDNIIREITNDPALSNIQDEKRRLMKWKIHFFGSA
jgi:hypothetical protein